jgi:hypothetical protein
MSEKSTKTRVIKKGTTINAKEMRESEAIKSEKALKKIFDDNETGRHSGPTDS